MSEKVTIGDAVLYCARSEEIIDDLEFDSFLTDPPYGLDGGSGTINKRNGKSLYVADFPDTEKYIEEICAPIIHQCIEKAERGAVTQGGKNARHYKYPDALGGFYQPAGTGMCNWGSVNFQPIFYYGKDPRLGKRIIPLVRQMNEHAPKNIHPCPKPEKPWSWLLFKVSLQNDVVFDPFMGTGTTGVCCAKMGRKFIGVELDARYFDLACQSIENAQKQDDLFLFDAAKPKNEKLI